MPPGLVSLFFDWNASHSSKAMNQPSSRSTAAAGAAMAAAPSTAAAAASRSPPQIPRSSLRRPRETGVSGRRLKARTRARARVNETPVKSIWPLSSRFPARFQPRQMAVNLCESPVDLERRGLRRRERRPVAGLAVRVERLERPAADGGRHEHREPAARRAPRRARPADAGAPGRRRPRPRQDRAGAGRDRGGDPRRPAAHGPALAQRARSRSCSRAGSSPRPSPTRTRPSPSWRRRSVSSRTTARPTA